MKEILTILLHIFLIVSTCYCPNKIGFFFFNEKINLLKRIELGLIFNFFLIFCLSFLYSINNLIFYSLYIIFASVNIFFFITENFNFKKIDNKFFLIFFLSIFLLINIILSDGIPLGWDAQNFWIIKKQIFSDGKSVFDLIDGPHIDYPYLGSFLWFFYSKISILEYEYFGRSIYIYLYLVSIFSLVNSFKLKENLSLTLAAIIFYVTYKSNLFNGYQEILIFSLLVILMNNFYYFLNKLKKGSIQNKQLLLFFFILHLLSWIKAEGLFLVIVFFISFTAIQKINLKTKVNFLFIIVFIIFLKISLFNFLGLENTIQRGSYDNIMKFSSLIEKFSIDRIFLIIQYFLYGLFENIIFLISIIIIILKFFFEKNSDYTKFNLILLFFLSGLYSAAFILTDINQEFHLYTAGNRLIFQFSGFFLYIFADQIIKILARINLKKLTS